MARRLIVLLCFAAVTALLAAPAGAGAAVSSSEVNQLSTAGCKAEKRRLGPRKFTKRYGRKGMKTCVKRQRGRIGDAYARADAQCSWELADFGADVFFWEWESYEECVDWYADEYLNPTGALNEDPFEDPEEEE